MSYLARKLITKAWQTAGIVAKNLQSVSGAQASEGLELFNELLATKTMQQELIPYFKEYTLNAVIGQEKYFIPGLIEIETFTFNLGTVRFPTERKGRSQYFGTGKAEGVQSLPFSWHLEKCLGGANLYLTFDPSETYALTIWGKFALDQISTLDDDLSLIYDLQYLVYLRYALAEYMCTDYNIPLPQQSALKLAELEESVIYISPKDFSVKQITSFGEAGVDWYRINILGGWTPP
jgi:hypothetical protein